MNTIGSKRKRQNDFKLSEIEHQRRKKLTRKRNNKPKALECYKCDYSVPIGMFDKLNSLMRKNQFYYSYKAGPNDTEIMDKSKMWCKTCIKTLKKCNGNSHDDKYYQNKKEMHKGRGKTYWCIQCDKTMDHCFYCESLADIIKDCESCFKKVCRKCINDCSKCIEWDKYECIECGCQCEEESSIHLYEYFDSRSMLNH